MVAQVSYHFSSVQLAMRGLLSWFVFFFFFFGRERYSLHKCNDSNLKSM